MYIFLDAFSKFIAVYFGRSTTSAEMILIFKQFVTDYGRYMRNGRVDEWYTDGGPEFASDSIDVFCTEMSTRHRFIAPWNPSPCDKTPQKTRYKNRTREPGASEARCT
jgi:hypothetical protein